jgi:uncharacterized protein (DUF433 family)
MTDDRVCTLCGRPMTTDDPEADSWDTGGHCLKCVRELENGVMADDAVQAYLAIDWSDCPLVQLDSDYHYGAPTMRSSPHTLVQALVVNYHDGESIEDLAYIFECPVDEVRAIIDYAAERS